MDLLKRGKKKYYEKNNVNIDSIGSRNINSE